MLLIASLIIWASMFLSILAAAQNETHTGYLSMEAQIISDLETYIDNQESVLQMLRKKLLTFKVEHLEALRNGDKYFSSELNKFLFIKRLSSDIDLMAKRTFEAANKFKSMISQYRTSEMLPSENDLRKSSLRIAQMQSVHKLRTDKIVRGFFGTEQKRTSLSTEDCYQIGKQLNSAEMYRVAIEWLKEALKLYNEYYDLHQVSVIEILEELAISFALSQQERQANDIIAKILRMDPNNQILSHIKHKDNRIRRNTLSDLCRPSELLSFLTSTCPT